MRAKLISFWLCAIVLMSVVFANIVTPDIDVIATSNSLESRASGSTLPPIYPESITKDTSKSGGCGDATELNNIRDGDKTTYSKIYVDTELKGYNSGEVWVNVCCVFKVGTIDSSRLTLYYTWSVDVSYHSSDECASIYMFNGNTGKYDLKVDENYDVSKNALPIDIAGSYLGPGNGLSKGEVKVLIQAWVEDYRTTTNYYCYISLYDLYIERINNPPGNPPSCARLDDDHLTGGNPRISWGEATDVDFGDTLTYYVCSGTSPSTIETDWSGTGTTCVLDRLAWDTTTTYYYRIIVNDGHDWAADYTDAEAFGFNDKPKPPTTCTELDDDHLPLGNPTISWSGARDGDDTTLTYYVYSGTSPTTTDLDWSGSNTSCVLDRLTWDTSTTYYYRIKVSDGHEDGGFTDDEAFGFNAKPTVPSSPMDLTLRGTNTKPSVSWSASTDGDDTKINYIVMVSDDRNNWYEDHNDTITTTNLDYFTLAKGEKYWWKVCAFDGHEYSDYTAPDEFALNVPPSKPLGLSPSSSDTKLIKGSADTITLSWTASTNDDVGTPDAIKYDVYGQLDNSNPSKLIEDDSTDTTATITGITKDGIYYWKVIARDGYENTSSDIVSFTIRIDTDADGIPDSEEEDDDNDGYSDQEEIDGGTDPLDPNEYPEASPQDTDGDGVPDSEDSDDDNDGYSDKEETDAGTDPLNDDDHPKPKPKDTDGDGTPDFQDDDDDGDGFTDSQELRENTDPLDKNCYPRDKPKTDTDKDGTPDSEDTDDDNDGMPDIWEIQYGLEPLEDDRVGDLDGDGYSNFEEFDKGTNPRNKNDYPQQKDKGKEEDWWRNWEPIVTIASITISVLVAVWGILFVRRKRSKLKGFIKQIEDIYARTSTNPLYCQSELFKVRTEIHGEFEKGKLDENQYLILDRKMDNYLNWANERLENMPKTKPIRKVKITKPLAQKVSKDTHKTLEPNDEVDELFRFEDKGKG